MEEGRKILHIMLDDKFIDYYIDQSEQVAPGVSDYWVIRAAPDEKLKYIKSCLVTVVGWRKEAIPELVKFANGYERIVLHSFLQPNIDVFVDGLSKRIIIVWMFWGRDGYSFTPNIRRWYLPLTWKWKECTLKRDIGPIRQILRRIKSLYKIYKESRRTRSVIRRVNICATWVEYDYKMLHHINRKMEWFYYSYFTYTQLGLDNLESGTLNMSRIWLGNSATDTNNHIDALNYLSSINWMGEIVVPLSYGSNDYGRDLISYGEKKFGNRFIPLVEFMPLNQYHEYMNSCGIIWMNHIRQQAAGNVLSALYMRKAVIMNKENNLYKTLSSWGIRFLEQTSIADIENIKADCFINNVQIIKRNLSIDRNLSAIRDLYGM